MTIQTRLGALYPNAKYSFDTDVYITIWRYYYPQDVFIKLWEDFEKLIKERVILSTYAVKKELSRQRDEIYNFIRQFPNLFVSPTEEEQQIVQFLVNHEDFDKWSSGSSESNYADPYVVALAKVHNLKVVTYEVYQKRNKIPRACEILNVDCIKFIDFLREEHLTY